MTKKNLPLFFFAGLLFLGFGCTKIEETKVAPITKTPIAPVVIKKPPVDPLDQAYQVCLAAGHEITVRFDETKQISRTYCVFSKGTACDALAFRDGTCTENSASKLPDSSLAPTPTKCTAKSGPVCGVNGTTFPNVCAAMLQYVAIVHTGPCTNQETKTFSQTAKLLGQPTETGLPNGALESPVWLPLAISLVRSEPAQNPRVVIEECPVAEGRLYYQFGAPNELSLLYNRDGAVLCYPSNDINGSCPAGFDATHRSNCRVVWRDGR